MGTEVKEYIFPAQTLTGSNFAPVYSDAINGKILKVVWDFNNSDTGGSVFLAASGGVTEEIHRVNGLSADVVAYPRVLPTNAANSSLSGTVPFSVERVVNGPLFIQGSGLTSGTVLNATRVFYQQA